MPTLKMNKDKILSFVKQAINYEDENNVESLEILFPKILNNLDLSLCDVFLNVINQDEVGEVVLLQKPYDEFNGYFLKTIPITNRFTYKAGNLKIWLKVLNSSNEGVAKTNVVTMEVKEHLDIENYIPEQELALLDQWQIYMNNTNDNAQQAILEATAQVTRAKDIADEIVNDVSDHNIDINSHQDIRQLIVDSLTSSQTYTDEELSNINTDITGLILAIQNSSEDISTLTTNLANKLDKTDAQRLYVSLTNYIAFTQSEKDKLASLLNYDDTQIQSDLSNEISARQQADTQLQLNIDTVEAIARGKTKARVFDTVSDLDTWLSNPVNTALLQIGDNFYIVETDKPDYWWDGSSKQKLETEKVDLTDYVTYTQGSLLYGAKENEHTHANKSVLDGITSLLVSAWDSAVTHISDTIKHITSEERTLWNTVSNKVDKVTGKSLIDNTAIIRLVDTSGTNTGDETASTIKTKLGIITLSGSNTGDQDLSSYQTKSDNTLNTSAKTIVGGINEVFGSNLVGKITVGKNLFDYTKATVDKYVRYTDGTLDVNTAYAVTDYIEILPNTTYVASYSHYTAFYDASKVFISGANITSATTPTAVTTPATAKYAKFTLRKSDYITTGQIEQGIIRTAFENYGNRFVLEVPANMVKDGIITNTKIVDNTITGTKLSDNTITSSKIGLQGVDIKNLSIATPSKNLFNISTSIDGYAVNHVNGTLISNSSYFVSDYIPIVAGQSYTCSYLNVSTRALNTMNYYAFYDVNKVFISGSNVGVATMSIPANVIYVRFSFTATRKNQVQFELGTSMTSYLEYGVYTLDVTPYIPSSYLSSNLTSSILKTVANGQLSETDVTFSINSPNLFDISKATVDKYVKYTDGTLSSNTDYTVSDYIPVTSSTTYIASYKHTNGKRTATNLLYRAFYDVNKVFISGSNVGVATITTPTNAVYMRVSVANINITEYMIEVGITISNIYYKGGKILDVLSLIDQVKLLAPATPSLYISLPSEFCVETTQPIEIYNKYISDCVNINNYTFMWNLSCGKVSDGKILISPTDVLSGTTQTLYLDVYDFNDKQIGTYTSNVKIKKAQTSLMPTAKNILCIGDSLTASKPWLTEVKRLVDEKVGIDKLNFIGTLGTAPIKHEGRSGATSSFYVTSEEWVTATNFRIKVASDTGAITLKKQYTIGSRIYEYETRSTINGELWLYFNLVGTGATLPTSGNLVEVNVGVSGVPSIIYTNATVASSNPFWNYTTNQLDVANYLTTNSLATPDYVVILLGANNSSNTFDRATAKISASSKANDIKLLVDNILSNWTNTKIFVAYNLFWASDSAYGNVVGAGMLERTKHMAIYENNVALKTMFNTYNTRVKLMPFGQCMDSEHNYPYTIVNGNTRNSDTVFQKPSFTDIVHPANAGYMQIADVVFGSLMNNL